MNSKDLLKYIQEKGYRSIEDILTNCSEENSEIVLINLDYLLSKNKIRRMKCLSYFGEQTIYYIPAGD
jgi:hypothetical protein